MNGCELRRLRERMGLSRRALSEMARVHPDTIRYHENKTVLEMKGYAVKRMLKALENRS